jgi:hypothetical protein
MLLFHQRRNPHSMRRRRCPARPGMKHWAKKWTKSDRKQVQAISPEKTTAQAEHLETESKPEN